jgi:6-phosphofructokinase 1
MGILVGGGPAPGINGVISAATIEAVTNGVDVLGFLEGFRYLVDGDGSHIRWLRIEDVSRIHFQGGSILLTSRTNPTKRRESLENTLRVFERHHVRYLLTIGGDDTAYAASQLSKSAGDRLAIAHVPKTIDNDLPLPPTIPTFGFQTARHAGVQIVQNLMADAQTAPRWYVVVAMGRKAGHLALGIGKAAAAPLILIPEEFGSRAVRFEEICDIVEGSIIKRRASHRDHGVALLAEGLVEHMTPEYREELFGAEDVVRDEYGNINLDNIELGRAVRDELRARFKARGLAITVINKNLGYELRCADPIPYDCEYTRDLGYGAVRYLLSGGTAAVITFHGGVMKPMPFDDDALWDAERRRFRVRMVDVQGESFQVALSYMIRLEARDRKDPEKFQALCHAANLSAEEFEKRFGYLMR